MTKLTHTHACVQPHKTPYTGLVPEIVEELPAHACTCKDNNCWSQHSKASVQITCGVINHCYYYYTPIQATIGLIADYMWCYLRPKSTPDVLERAIMEGYEHRVSPSREGVQVLRMYFFIKE